MAGSIVRWAAAASALILAAGCATAPGPVRPPAGFPALRIAVISDPHIFDTASSSPGAAFDGALLSGIKLLAESRRILESALPAIAAERPDIVLVCGDLTRDGERASHELASRELASLEQAAAGEPAPRVYVVPGNHDVRNPHAARFEGDSAIPVPSVSPREFSAIYAELGYDEALARDPASLSYVAQPVPGLWLLAIDSCRYGENGTFPVPGGRVSPTSLAWIEGVLADARSRGVAVIAFMHHNLLEHFRGQRRYEPGRVVDQGQRLTRTLLRGNVRLVFSGHGHAQDIAELQPGQRQLLDVETGSLVSFPNPWRIVRLQGSGRVEIASRAVTGIAGMGEGFPRYSLGRLREGLREFLAVRLARAGVQEPDADGLAGAVADTAVQYYRGDEHTGPVDLEVHAASGWGRTAARVLEGPLRNLGNDLPPADNELVITLPR